MAKLFFAGLFGWLSSQEPVLDNTKTVKEVVMEGLSEIVDILKSTRKSIINLWAYER